MKEKYTNGTDNKFFKIIRKELHDQELTNVSKVDKIGKKDIYMVTQTVLGAVGGYLSLYLAITKGSTNRQDLVIGLTGFAISMMSMAHSVDDSNELNTETLKEIDDKAQRITNLVLNERVTNIKTKKTKRRSR